MVYPFVPAKYFTPGGMTEARAMLWHMAEGGGTVAHLTHPPTDNSAHFVVEYSGRIVQMVKLKDASHSAHLALDSDSNDATDCDGLYSPAIARAVLGLGYSDLNRFVVAVEVEGFRADGPNADQAAAIARLHRDMRRSLPSLRGNLGHRDVQDYKGCPGCKFPWAAIEGHGLYREATMTDPVRISETLAGATVALTKGDSLLEAPTMDPGAVASHVTEAMTVPAVFRSGVFVAIAYPSVAGYDRLLYVLRADVDVTRPVPGATELELAAANARIAAAQAALGGPV